MKLTVRQREERHPVSWVTYLNHSLSLKPTLLLDLSLSKIKISISYLNPFELGSCYQVKSIVGIWHFLFFFYNEGDGGIWETNVVGRFPTTGEDFKQGPWHPTYKPGTSSSLRQETKVSFLAHIMTFSLWLQEKQESGVDVYPPPSWCLAIRSDLQSWDTW